jgi:hypothetical protein
MVCFFQRGGTKLTVEIRTNPDGPGYQLVVTENATALIESFDTLPKLLEREHELLLAWRAQGWRDIGQLTRTPVDRQTGSY